jgi:outer membrane protein OmpA-like peptidoglycan-associated protein
MEQRYRQILKTTVGSIAITMCLQSFAQANETAVYSYHGKDVSAHDIISHFIGDCATNDDPVKCRQSKSVPRTRGIRIHSERRVEIKSAAPVRKRSKSMIKAAASVYAAVASKRTDRPSRHAGKCPKNGSQVALPITFALNSAILESAAYTNLRQMALAMKSDALSSCKFVVEGHTDASGGASLNLELSKKRAYAVREFLVSMAINSSRLVPVGKGEAEPLPKRDPQAAENRRVQFRIIQK